MNFKLLACAAAALLPFAPPAGAAADSAAAVLSSGGGAYMEAFSAFQAAYGASVKYYDASKERPELPAGVKTVVAFGAKAASQAYPAGMNVVYCMAPGFFLSPKGREGRTVKISMIPGFGNTLAKFKEIQPALKRLRVFWILPDFTADAEELRAEGAARGIEISTVKVEAIAELPGLLRRGLGEMDAFWLPPDPFLISPESLMMLREFSWGNSIPFYASTKGIAREGAAAAVGASFAEIGAAAAAAAKSLQAGETPAATIYPGKEELTLNATAAKKCGLEFTPEILREASYLFP
ncbi:MAG: ABC transporter substrate binding protein [Elusimicrobiota bacterium]